jgi:hypothetical protein
MRRYYVDRKCHYQGMWPICDREKDISFDKEIAYGVSRGEAEKIRDALNTSNEIRNAIRKVLNKVRGGK